MDLFKKKSKYLIRPSESATGGSPQPTIRVYPPLAEYHCPACLSLSVFTTSLEPTLSKIPDERKPRHCLAPLGNSERKNTPCIFDFAHDRFFLKMGRTFFFLGVLPSKYSGKWRNNADVANGKGGVWGGIFHLLRYFLLAKFGRGFWRPIN